jgi:hypothetical protein
MSGQRQEKRRQRFGGSCACAEKQGGPWAAYARQRCRQGWPAGRWQGAASEERYELEEGPRSVQVMYTCVGPLPPFLLELRRAVQTRVACVCSNFQF